MANAEMPLEILYEEMHPFNDLLIQQFTKDNPNYGPNYFRYFFLSKLNEKKRFNMLTIDDVINHVYLMEKNQYAVGSINTFLTYLRQLVKYAKEKYPNDFYADFLKGLETLKAEDLVQDSSTKKQNPEALNAVQLDAVRQFIKTNKRLSFLFELFFQLPIKKKDLNKYCSKNYKQDKQGFFENGQLLNKVTPRLHELILNMNVNDWPPSTSIIYKDLPKISRHLYKKGLYPKDKNFTYSDIELTREKYFLKCPYCGSVLENLKENWVLIQVNEGSIRLCCVVCKGMVNNDGTKV